MTSETWIVYKSTTPSAHGWENRQLMPNGDLTNILAEEWDYSGRLPQVGDRVREYESLKVPGDGATHGCDGNWVVSRIVEYSSFDVSDRIMVCYCDYSPIAREWEPLKRGAPVDEMLAAEVTP